MRSILDDLVYIMGRSFRRRSIRTRILRTFLLASGIAFLLDSLFFVCTFSRQPLFGQPALQPTSPSRLFISSTHWNNEAALRGFWNQAVVDLAKHVGPGNVYVSIYESGSWDDSKGALRLLDQDLEHLGVQRTIILDDTTHQDEMNKPPADSGWIDTPRGRKELRRIPFLAKLRNLTLKPLIELSSKGIRFDKVLFLNDVVFSVSVEFYSLFPVHHPINHGTDVLGRHRIF